MQQPADYTGIPGYADGKDITGIVPYGQNKIPRYPLFGNPLANPIIPNIPKIKIGAQPDMLSP